LCRYTAGIPDFRGPKGIWTLQRAGAPIPKASCQFDRARPSLTHMALVALQREGYIRFLVSCNVDCLHLRSGYPRDQMAELHGNCFAERCEKCEAEYIRDFEMPSVGFKVTGRKCTAAACAGAARLRDQVLDWEDALPPKELKRAGGGCASC
jgi:mono-ADP-ribosyltransferase sirtuin 6